MILLKQLTAGNWIVNYGGVGGLCTHEKLGTGLRVLLSSTDLNVKKKSEDLGSELDGIRKKSIKIENTYDKTDYWTFETWVKPLWSQISRKISSLFNF